MKSFHRKNHITFQSIKIHVLMNEGEIQRELGRRNDRPFLKSDDPNSHLLNSSGPKMWSYGDSKNNKLREISCSNLNQLLTSGIGVNACYRFSKLDRKRILCWWMCEKSKYRIFLADPHSETRAELAGLVWQRAVWVNRRRSSSTAVAGNGNRAIKMDLKMSGMPVQ